MSKLSAIVFLMILSSFYPNSDASEGTPSQDHFAHGLLEYVKKADPSFSWKVEKTVEGADSTTFFVHLKSQTWRTATEVKKPLWEHTLTVVRPKSLKSHKSLLYVSNGTSHDPLPGSANELLLKAAVETHSVVAEIRNVPNQPMVYFNDGEERYEDNSVAYSWIKAMETHDPTWNVRLPCVKSVVRAMDSIQALMLSQQGGHFEINDFVVMGASKRGLTTWLTPVVDPRVSAIIPMVTDNLNLEKFLKHHFSAYGFWAPSFKDYIRHGFIDKIFTPEFYDLITLDDPYSYIEKMSLPKYIVNSMNDQFFLPDGSRYYFDDLPGKKFLRVVPNCDHYLRDQDAVTGALGFYSALVSDLALPDFSWTKDEDGTLKLKTSILPEKVLLWQAHSAHARDFRPDSVGKNAFTSQELRAGQDGVFVGQVKRPAEGFTAFVIEAQFASGSVFPLKFSTEVSVVPDILPFKEQFKKNFEKKRKVEL